MNRILAYAYILTLTRLPLLAQTEEPIQLKTGSLTLEGTLTMPANAKSPVPVVLLAGSGPTDRDGNNSIPAGQVNSVKANSYKMLADSLARLGLAVVRYDKRGIGRSVPAGMMTEKDLTFEQYIQDAQQWLYQLRSDKRFSRLIMAGHSEGSLIGMVAGRQAKVDAFISLAGPGDDIAGKLKAQLGPQLPDAAREEVFKALDSLKAGRTLSRLPTSYPAVQQLFRPGIQPYLISWMKYDPAAQIKQLTIPVLIIQGGRDAQVTVSDAQKLKQAYPRAELRLFHEMNHIFKNAETNSIQEAMASYANPNLPLTPGLATTIAQFAKR